jgi:hypothetical protein
MIEYKVKVHDSGSREWYLNGNLHREDGPAVEYADGMRCWYLNGELHREDGPAIEEADDCREWYLNDKKVTEQEVMKPVKELTVAEVEKLLGHKVKIIK